MSTSADRLSFDEEELLKYTSGSDPDANISLDLIDEDAILGDLNVSGADRDDENDLLQNDHQGEDQYLVPSDLADAEQAEELDYDDEEEDDRREERTGRFTSERSKATASKSDTTTTVSSSLQNGGGPIKKTWTTSSSRGQWINRGRVGNFNMPHRGRGGFMMGGPGRGGMGGPMGMVPMRGGRGGGPMMMRGGGGMRGGRLPPPLMGLPMAPPPHLLNSNGIRAAGGGPGDRIPAGGRGGKILLNPNFVPQQPLVRLNIAGDAPIGMMPPSVANLLAGPAGPVIPRLPNGIPLTGLPPNHGVAGFGGPSMIGMPPGTQPGVHWDQAVAAFLNQPAGGQVSSSSRHRSSRRRSRSSSYSSYSSYSSRSRSSASRSRSRTPPRRRRHHHKSSRSGRGDRKTRNVEHSNSYKTRGGNGGTYGNRNQSRDGGAPRYNRDRRDDREVAAECAKVVGVDSDYLSRVEEQKRRREENVRQKERRRFGHEEKTASTSTPSGSGSTGHHASREGREEQKPPVAPATSDNGKKKAYLCVTVKNLTHLPTARSRVDGLATEMGAVRKCWQATDDQVNVIFTEHDKAKAFMLKYNGKVLSGLRINVGLEKAFLNLAEIR